MTLLGALFGIIWQLLFFQVTPLGGIPIGSGGGSGTSFVTGETLGSTQTTGGSCEGFVFTMGTTPITVTQLGRWVLSGNTGTHTLTMNQITAGNGTSVANCSVNTSGQGVGFTYCPISSTVLSASTQYGLFDMSNTGGDSYYIIPTTTITHTSVATTNGGTYGSISGNNCLSLAIDTDSTTYGPLDFKYQ